MRGRSCHPRWRGTTTPSSRTTWRVPRYELTSICRVPLHPRSRAYSELTALTLGERRVRTLGASGQPVGVSGNTLTVTTVTVTSGVMRARRRQRVARRRAADKHDSADAPVYTIDKLAAATGVPSRTVRHYQWVGVLPPPVRKGRIAFYRDEHLQRLRLIAQLQDRGLHLRAIRDALRQAVHRRLSLEEWLGIGEHLRQPWSVETPLVLSEVELGQRLGDRPAGFVARLERARLLRRHGDPLAPTYLVRSPGLLDIGLKLHDAGLGIETGAEAAALIRHSMRRAAAKLVKHFTRRSGRGFGRGRSADAVGETLTALRSLGADAVRLVFAQEVERALRAAMKKGAIPAPDHRSRSAPAGDESRQQADRVTRAQRG
jgi:MerR-like DNA binding protein